MILFEFLNHSGQDATAVDNNEHNAEVIFKQLDILGLFHLRIKSIFVSTMFSVLYGAWGGDTTGWKWKNSGNSIFGGLRVGGGNGVGYWGSRRSLCITIVCPAFPSKVSSGKVRCTWNYWERRPRLDLPLPHKPTSGQLEEPCNPNLRGLGPQTLSSWTKHIYSKRRLE